MKPRDILRDDSGATIIEFALLGPIVLGLMIGVIQIGLAMQSYNAIRSVTAETARFALVQYQQGNEPTNAQIRAQALGIADGPPYLLDPNDLVISVNDATVQRVNGAKELTVSVAYQTPTVLPFFTWVSPTVATNGRSFCSTTADRARARSVGVADPAHRGHDPCRVDQRQLFQIGRIGQRHIFVAYAQYRCIEVVETLLHADRHNL